MKTILMILTSHKKMEHTTQETGMWLSEFTDPYYEFIDEGYRVVLASPKGGEPPVDPSSLKKENITDTVRRFQDDTKAQQDLKNTLSLDMVDVSDYDALFYPGGHGPIWDLATSRESGELILAFLASKKPVAAVCHGPAALIKAAEMEPGLLKGKKLTAFTNQEEEIVHQTEHVPYLLENRLRELGAEFHSASTPFDVNVEKDGLLITGQNPMSAGPAAQELIKVLEAA